MIRGGENRSGETVQHDVLVAAMKACHIPCQIEGLVDYTINPSRFEVKASPMEITYADAEQRFRFRGDAGEFRVWLGSDGEVVDCLFSGNVVIEIGDWRATADSFEMEEAGYTLRGDIVIEPPKGQREPIIRADKFFLDQRYLDSDFESINEFITAAIQQGKAG